MKKCNICKEIKNDDDFYKGHARCKSCYIAKVKNHRAENREHYLEYDKKRSGSQKRVDAINKYLNTEKGKLASTKSKIKWVKKSTIKRSAHIILGNAIRDGKITKEISCSECGKTNERIHGHHDDYAFPLSVRWLCSKCHTAWHKENGEGKNA